MGAALIIPGQGKSDLVYELIGVGVGQFLLKAKSGYKELLGDLTRWCFENMGLDDRGYKERVLERTRQGVAGRIICGGVPQMRSVGLSPLDFGDGGPEVSDAGSLTVRKKFFDKEVQGCLIPPWVGASGGGLGSDPGIYHTSHDQRT